MKYNFFLDSTINSFYASDYLPLIHYNGCVINYNFTFI